MAKTPIERIKDTYDSAGQHLRAIEDALVTQFNIPDDQRIQVRMAVDRAYGVGRRTITTDDWCDSF